VSDIDPCTGDVQPLEVMGRQEIQQQQQPPVEINLSEMSPFISASQTQLQPQVSSRVVSYMMAHTRVWSLLCPRFF